MTTVPEMKGERLLYFGMFLFMSVFRFVLVEHLSYSSILLRKDSFGSEACVVYWKLSFVSGRLISPRCVIANCLTYFKW